MNLHGPQDDRDRHWNGRWDHHREDLARKEAEVCVVVTFMQLNPTKDFLFIGI